ncbi:endonuclease/exonuclease/phosphatase family protein [Candidatus Sumerlaeota bacterium]|nr:endonuclease/exonuclease/phosphatase family protein [Candidatus Sumerlaeota bacterium]
MPATQLKILTYNLHHGEGLDKVIDLERIGRLIRESRADIVALQEIDRGCQRTGGVDQFAEYERLSGMRGVFGKSIDYQGGEYGLGVLSRFPARAVESVMLPRREGRERRQLFVTKVALSDADKLLFIDTHLDFDEQNDTDRMKSMDVLDDWLAAQPAETPMLLCGDFNSRPDTPVLERIRRHWSVAGGDAQQLTFPANAPVETIDYICLRPAERWNVVKYEVIEEPVASDHRPVLVEIELA